MLSLTHYSHKQVSIWTTLIFDALITAFYFTKVLSLPADVTLTSVEMARVLMQVMIIAIVLAIILFSGVHFFTQHDPKDERDYWVDAQATKVAYGVLSLSLVIIIGHTAVAEIFAADLQPLFDNPSMQYAHLLLLALIASSMLRSVTQLILYRRH
ncbi:hypothetical protein HMF8227_02641 [Saliniradius amylolyticus]|uniref:Uncharacterized protein n=1 Tax=Saliniradius amylolyticus TaxID=2183582 RepID=A0A2S2E636_9ALTE|nr:hypothetical protein [Saliniradius amylolyticus]AWL13093.1 hypothetical protein HMF8227_02641 [Saliniradius amylolyticus]